MTPRQARARARILDVALGLLNLHGERNVTSKAITAAMNSSPGCLYYHFNGKGDIVTALFIRFEEDICRQIEACDRPLSPQEVEVCLAGLLQVTWHYRFLYRDLHDLLSRYTGLKVRFRRILGCQRQLVQRLFDLAGAPLCPHQAETCSANITLLLTYWFSFENVADPRSIDSAGWATQMVNSGVRQIMFAAHSFASPMN